MSEERGVLGSSGVMAAGTAVSRLSGYVRTGLLAAALGNQLHADQFTIANTIPNMLYILLAGGIFNAVLVPQLVRAGQRDPDGGDSYTNRIVTLAALVLGVVTLLLVLGAPWVMDVYLDDSWADPALAAQRESVIDFARYCLPQVFFYAMFVLVGQILNARGTFGPMMWAPIANNVIAVTVLVIYLVTFGPASEEGTRGPFTASQELLLGLGSTLGIMVQLLILVPWLRAAGFRFRPRFDFRHTGLGHTLRLGAWTVGFVVVNQLAYTVVVRLASSGTAQAASSGEGTGYTVYASTFLIMMVPHSIVTVSLATAVLPRLSAHAAESDRRALSDTLAQTMRTALAVIVPFAMLLPLVADELATVVWGYGAAAGDVGLYVPSLSLFAPGLLFFTVHYLVLRGFYALEQTRTTFWVQCAVAATNVSVAWLLVHQTSPALTTPSLVVAYAVAYLVGAVISYQVLRRRLSGLQSPVLVRFAVRVLLAGAGAALAALLVHRVVSLLVDPLSHPVWAGLTVLLMLLADGVVLVALARLLSIREVTEIAAMLTRRIPVLRRTGTGA